jgi:hypothetical protein
LKKDEDDADGEATDDLSGDSFKSTEKNINDVLLLLPGEI